MSMHGRSADLEKCAIRRCRRRLTERRKPPRRGTGGLPCHRDPNEPDREDSRPFGVSRWSHRSDLVRSRVGRPERSDRPQLHASDARLCSLACRPPSRWGRQTGGGVQSGVHHQAQSPHVNRQAVLCVPNGSDPSRMGPCAIVFHLPLRM